MYAVVKAGGKQHKVAVGDVLEVNRLEGDAGEAVNLPALLLVDGHTVVSEAAALAKISVTGEIVGHHKGPKIKILKYKNKTGYRKRIGHRQLLTELLVTDIDDGTPKKKAKAEPAKSAKSAKSAKADADAKPAKSAKTAAAKPDSDEKPAKATKASAKAAPAKATAKADSDEKPAKAAKAATAKAAKATKTTKSAKATSAKATSAKASDTDEKKKD